MRDDGAVIDFMVQCWRTLAKSIVGQQQTSDSKSTVEQWIGPLVRTYGIVSLKRVRLTCQCQLKNNSSSLIDSCRTITSRKTMIDFYF